METQGGGGLSDPDPNMEVATTTTEDPSPVAMTTEAAEPHSAEQQKMARTVLEAVRKSRRCGASGRLAGNTGFGVVTQSSKWFLGVKHVHTSTLAVQACC